MKKTLPAFIAALLITVGIGAGMIVVGQDSLSASAAEAATAQTNTALTAEQISQFEQIVAQYQGREALYQNQINEAIVQINTANQTISQANQQLQEYQSLLQQLQSSGLITIESDGTITINQTSQAGFMQPPDHHGAGH